MPLWLLIIGGITIYLWAKSNAQAGTTTAQLPQARQTPSGSTSWADDIPTAQSAVPAPMQVGQSLTLPAGTKLYSDSKLTNATGSVLGTGSLSVNVTATSVAADGSISGSYTDAAGNTFWFAQPGT